MSDYSGNIEYVVTKGNDPITRPRVRVANGYLDYGVYIMDRAVEKGLIKGKKVLWKGASRDEADKIAKKLFEGGELPEVDFNEEIVIPNRVAKFNSYCKYVCDRYYSVPTVKDLEKLIVFIIKEMNDNQMFWKPEPPIKPAHTQKDIDDLPEVFNKEEYQKELDRYNKKLKQYGWEYSEWEHLQKAIKGDVKSVVTFAYDSDRFTNIYEIIDPEII